MKLVHFSKTSKMAYKNEKDFSPSENWRLEAWAYLT